MQQSVATLLEWVAEYGFVAIFFLMTLESACLPVPSEPVMVYGGYLVYAGHMSFIEATAAGTLGNLLGSLIAYMIGFYGGGGVYRVLRRHGVTAHKLESADKTFHKWGEPSVLLSRMLPVIRTFISLPAGVARMRLGRFVAFTLIGALPFNAGLVWAGKASGRHWKAALEELHTISYAALGVAVVLVVGAYLLWRWRARPSSRSEAATQTEIEEPVSTDGE